MWRRRTWRGRRARGPLGWRGAGDRGCRGSGVADSYVAAPDLAEAPVAAAFAVKVSGDSMMPEYGEGEILIVGPGEAKDGDDCIVRLDEQENFATTFKRVTFEREGNGEVTAV